jgi:hypothetical protein
MDLQVANRAKVVALAIKTYYFTLSSELILELDNYFFFSVLSRNIISIFYLAFNGFKFIIEGKCCYFYNNGPFFMDLMIIQMVCMYLILRCPCLI